MRDNILYLIILLANYFIVFSDENLGPPHLSKLVNSLLTGLQGRTWEGKV